MYPGRPLRLTFRPRLPQPAGNLRQRNKARSGSRRVAPFLFGLPAGRLESEDEHPDQQVVYMQADIAKPCGKPRPSSGATAP